MMQIPQSFEFLIHPKIVSGKCALENIPSELNGYGAQKPLVIAAKQLARSGRVKKLIKSFYDSSTVIGAIYDEVLDYAGITQARQAAELFSQRGCDAVIALGNGPVVDLAKAANVLVSEKCDTLRPNSLGTVVSRPLKPMFIVPGCAFDGWEATQSMAVDNRRIQSDFFFPETIFIDPRIVTGDSSKVLAASGAIAIAQVFDALGLWPYNPMVDAIAHPAMRLLEAYLNDAVENPKNPTACLAVANASVMAGAAMANTGPPIIHLLAESLAGATNIPAGDLMPTLLSALISIIQSKKISIREELCLAILGLEAFSAAPAEKRLSKALERILTLLDELMQILPSSFQALRIQAHLLDQAAQDAAVASEGRFGESECRLVLRQAWENGAKKA